MPGTIISAVEVTHVSKHGFWLLLDAEELLVPFEHFPWFRNATIAQRSDVQWPAHSVESIRNPSALPLISKKAAQPGVAADRFAAR